MKPLYAVPDVLTKIRTHLTPLFEGFGRQTTQTLIWIIVAMLALEGARSVRNLHTGFLSELDLVSLSTLYRALSYAKRPAKRVFTRMIAKLALKCVRADLKDAPCFLCVDDTLIPKFGKKFDGVGILFDHAAHDGRRYKNGHCLVCIALAVPVGIDTKTKKVRYLCVPLILKIWQKGGPSKLQIAYDLLVELRNSLQPLGSFIFLMDSWYPRAPLLNILDAWPELELICAVRCDTVLYDLPPKRTGKRGRPRKRGDRLHLDDFTMKACGMKGYLAGRRRVLTKLFGSRQMTAFVTGKADGTGSRRLYLSTLRCHDVKRFGSCAAAFCEAANDEYLPIHFYRCRWMIEVIFYELKTFWSLGDYMVRNAEAIDLFLNLIVVAYAFTKTLPCIDDDFEAWQELSSQEVRHRLGRLICQRVFLWKLSRDAQSTEKQSQFEKALAKHLGIFANLR